MTSNRGRLAGQSVIVIQNNQKVTADTVNNSIANAKRDYWSERIGFRIARQGDYAFYAVAAGLATAARDNPDVDLDTLRYLANSAMSYYDNPSLLPRVAGQDAGLGAVTSIVSMDNPYIGMATPIVMDLMSAHLSDQLSGLYPIDQEKVRDHYLTDGPDGLKKLWEDSQKDLRVKTIIDELVRKRYGQQISTADIPGINPDLDLDTYKAALKTLAFSPKSSSDIPKAFNTFAAAQNRRLDAMEKRVKTELSRAPNSRIREDKLAEFKREIDDQRAALYLATFAIGIVNPSLGKTIGSVGDAYLKVSEAEGLYRQGKTSSLRLTADVVSAGVALITLLNSNGPTADEVILQQIRDLSKQIEGFRQEMHARFDHVDQSLSKMYVDLIANFNQVNVNVLKARQGIIGLQLDLVALQGQLGDLDRRVQSYAQGLSSQITSKNAAYCLDLDSYGISKALDSDKFADCELGFTNAGTVVAKNAVWTNQSKEFIDDASIAANLKFPIEQNINYLWALAAAKFGFHPAPYVSVANPVVWVANANGYMQLVSTARPLASTVRPTDDLIHTGEELRDAINALGQRQSLVSGSFETIFDRLLPAFVENEERARLDVALLEATYIKTAAAGYSPWGTPSQSTESSNPGTWTFSTAPMAANQDVIAVVGPCPDAKDVFDGNSLQAPAKLATLVPLSFRMAQELGLGQVKACYSNPHEVGHVRIPGTDSVAGKLSLEILITFTPVASIKTTTEGKKNRRTSKSGEGSPPVEPIPLHIAHRGATASQPWIYDCDQRNPYRGSIQTGIDRATCLTARANGFTAADMKEALPFFWAGNSGLQKSFVDSSPDDMDDPKLIATDLATSQDIIERCLQYHRKRLRTEISTAIRGDAGSPDFVSEERIAVVNDFRVLRTLKSLIDSYVAITLSRSIDKDETLARSLGEVAPNNWSAEIERSAGSRILPIELSSNDNAQGRVLLPLGLSTRTARLRRVLDERLANGSESYGLIETTLANLKALRILQVTRSLSSDHVCFSSNVNATFHQQAETSIMQKGYKDADGLTSIRVIIKPGLVSESLEANKVDVLVGNAELLMSGVPAADSQSSVRTDVSTFVFAGNGMVLRQLREGGVRICRDYGQTAPGPTSSVSVVIEVSMDGREYLTYQAWQPIPFPSGKKVSILLKEGLPEGGTKLKTDR